MKLREYRKLKGLTITQAAGEIGVSHVAWGYWEKGKRTPEEANMAAIAKWSKGAVMPNDFYLLPHTGT
jgi:transcriptional regulator with XRE-family HTH domain